MGAQASPQHLASWRMPLGNEAVLERINRSLRTVAHFQLLENGSAVVLDGLFGEVEFVAYFAVACALGNQPQNLKFAVCESFPIALLAQLAHEPELVEHLESHSRIGHR